ncbi:MAG: zinc/manganese transport system permease protein [Marinobacter maritimus]|uniref:metal ABC transporter permease n=1 Tax=Marinobacter maritimus TaxID=277961 RepID=UPI000BC545FB|nr:metal ABC transporter permease [Marinobacter maritimus]MBL1272010.1 metal ABC transporter permease [Oceanospirillales bacterium]
MAAYEWMLLPVSGSVLLCFLLVPLGYQVIARGVIFADLAIAQWASLGTLAGTAGTCFVLNQNLAGASVTSLVFALLAAVAVQLILRHLGEAKEAGIGILYVLGASFAVLLVSNDPHGAQSLQRAASGDLLWASQELVIATAVMAFLVWLLGYWFPGWISGAFFIPVFAIAVTYAVSLAGIYVVFATLIITPLIVGSLHGKKPLTASICAIIGHLLAIACSVIRDVPVGPAIVVATLFTACVWPIVVGQRRFNKPKTD